MAAKNGLDDYKARNPDNIKGIERKGPGYLEGQTCQGVINQFHTMFPNIKLKLIDQIQGGLGA